MKKNAFIGFFIFISLLGTAFLIFISSDIGYKKLITSLVSYIFCIYIIYGFLFDKTIVIPGSSIKPDDPYVYRISLFLCGIVGIFTIFSMAWK